MRFCAVKRMARKIMPMTISFEEKERAIFSTKGKPWENQKTRRTAREKVD